MKICIPVQASFFLIFSMGQLSVYAEDKSSYQQITPPIQVGNIININVFAHPVCTFQLPNEINSNNYVFAEGDICSDEGDKCRYYALMNINRKDVTLRRINLSKDSKSAKFEANTMEVKVNYILTQCWPDKEYCETATYNATITLIKGKNKQQIKVSGECGA